jgi:transcriptional regulator with XRE-family HTH domain
MADTSAEELASALRRLKNRRGRSFDALARRLGVSRSALHRYTTGTALPAHFSIVELLARECGATAKEVAELRRLWRLATECRAFPQPEQEPAAPSMAPAVAPSARAEAEPPAVSPPPSTVPPAVPSARADAMPAAAPAIGAEVAVAEVAPHAVEAPVAVRQGRFRTGRWTARAAGTTGWRLILWFVFVAAVVTGTAAATRLVDGEAGPSTAHRSPDPSAQPRTCELRTGINRLDRRRSGYVWKSDYLCPNRADAPLYAEPGGAQRVSVMDTTRSWFACWTYGPRRPDGQRSVWYYSRGDETDAGAESYGGWGFVAAQDVMIDKHPFAAMPACFFGDSA